MDYLSDDDSVAASTPQTYDVSAIAYLCGLSPDAPAQPFCTDEDQLVEPLCAQFDLSADPLAQDREPRFDLICFVIARDGTFDGYAPFFPSYILPTLNFVRAGSSADALYAWNGIIVSRVGTTDNPLRFGDSPLLLNRMSQYVSTSLLIDTEVAYPNISGPPLDPQVISAIVQEAAAQLANADGVRTFATRQTTIHALKAAQTLEPYQVLLDAAAAFDAELEAGTLDPAAALKVRDLRALLNEVVSPYFI
jgi:hypothetical protein